MAAELPLQHAPGAPSFLPANGFEGMTWFQNAITPESTTGTASAKSNDRSSELGKAFPEAEAGRILADGLKHFDLDEAALRKTAEGNST